MPVVGFSVSGEFHLTDSEGIVSLETTPLSSVIRLPLADLFRHQDWVACGLEEQPVIGEPVTAWAAFRPRNLQPARQPQGLLRQEMLVFSLLWFLSETFLPDLI